MKSFISYLVFLTVITTITTAPSSTNPTLVDVKVRHISKRSDINGDISSSFSVSVNGPSGHNYDIAVESPTASVFSKNFKYTIAKEDEKGNSIFLDETPSEKILRNIEDNIYIDQESDSAISIKNTENGYQIRGIVNNHAIIPAEQNRYQMIPVKSARTLAQPGDTTKDIDYIDLHRNISYPKFDTRASIFAQPEIWVFFDFANSEFFGQDRDKILDYLGVMFHAINNRYATIEDPSISFLISGVTTVSSLSSQPFLEDNAVPDGSGYDINKALGDFSTWSYTNQGSGPKFDMAAVISGAELQTLNSAGVYTSSIAGLAYLSAACWKSNTRWYATSVTEDKGGLYNGMFNIAHEFGHNLGAPHDGSVAAVNCSWDDGYIMSYKGWGTSNKFLFSPCSINLMRNYISSTQGSCVKSIQASTNIPLSSDDIGDRFNMTALCVGYTKQTNAFPEPTKTGNELCKNLVCRYPTPGKPAGYFSIATLNHPPGDNTPCGTSGEKCVNGFCV